MEAIDYQLWRDLVECSETGMPGHEQCGWCRDHGVPRAMCLCKAPKRSPYDELVELPPIQLQTLSWAPVMEGDTAVVFVATAMACQCCAFRIRAHCNTLTSFGHIEGGRRGNVLWRSKGIDIADKCEFCGMDLSDKPAEELRFWVKVQS